MSTNESKRGRGRPPKEEPLVRGYKKLTVYMEPVLKAQVHAAGAILNLPAWKVVNDAVRDYIERLPKADKDALNGLAERLQERTA